ncbi:ABC transporter ATP-binding protein/permease, partial [Leptospira santarosai]|nr:ABC transporter ATP-binding protein/permease [Leptospira santarosai]
MTWSNQFNTVLSAIAGAERVFAIIDEPIEKDEATSQLNMVLKGKVEFDQVSFKYEQSDDDHTIRDVSFTLNPGETAALVGATGAGKTTIMQLLARFYETNEGQIRIDDIPIDQLAR